MMITNVPMKSSENISTGTQSGLPAFFLGAGGV